MKTLPLRRRNLPDSFFSQQAANRGGGAGSMMSGQHSRENSTDSGYGQQGTAQVPAHSASHTRSQSLPASFSGASLRQQSSSFESQQSAGSAGRSLYLPGHRIVVEDDGLGPLPNGWSIAVTAEGQKYFIDHVSKRTMWEDPRLSLRKEDDSLPEGWQRAFTDDGTPYFINHHDRTTTWTKPNSTASQTVASIGHHPPPSAHQNVQVQAQQQGHHTRSQSLQHRNQKLRIQRLQQEREMLRLQREREVLLRQHQALLQKEIKLKQLVDDLGGVQQRDPMMSSVASVAGSGLTYHSRESSADYSVETVSNNSSSFIPQQTVHADSGLLDTFGEMGIGDGAGPFDDSAMIVRMQGMSQALAATAAGTSAMQYSTTTVQPSTGMLSDILDSMEGTSVDETPNMGIPPSHAMETDADVAPDFLSEVRSLLSNAGEPTLFSSDNFS
jgi:hypothetical protein